MVFAVVPTQDRIQEILRAFLIDILPGIDEQNIFEGQDNRVPEPHAEDFLVFQIIRRDRIETNIDDSGDVKFTGSIAAAVLTVTAVDFGEIAEGNFLFGVGVAAGSQIGSLISGTPGGIGTYNITPSQTLTSRTLSAGVKNMLQPTKLTFQLDVHGPNGSNNAQIISTAFRDEYATAKFLEIAGDDDAVTPLYADDPKQIPFQNAEQQWETRYVLEAVIQANQTIKAPQEYADTVDVGIVSVEATYPP